MSRNAERSLFAGIGALFVVACLHVTARLCHRHFLDIKEQS